MSRSERIYTWGQPLKFGKFRGRPVSKDFIIDEIGYFKWLVEEKVCEFTIDILNLIKKTKIMESPIYYEQEYDYKEFFTPFIHRD